MDKHEERLFFAHTFPIATSADGKIYQIVVTDRCKHRPPLRNKPSSVRFRTNSLEIIKSLTPI